MSPDRCSWMAERRVLKKMGRMTHWLSLIAQGAETQVLNRSPPTSRSTARTAGAPEQAPWLHSQMSEEPTRLENERSTRPRWQNRCERKFREVALGHCGNSNACCTRFNALFLSPVRNRWSDRGSIIPASGPSLDIRNRGSRGLAGWGMGDILSRSANWRTGP